VAFTPSLGHQLTAARERVALEDHHGAIVLLEGLLEAGHAYADVYHLLGLARGLLGHHAKALEAFDAALALNPGYLEAHIHRGIVLSTLGRTEEADTAFRSAAREGGETVAGLPKHAAASLANRHADLAEAYLEAGDPVEATAQFERALELGPAFHDLRYRLARLLLERGHLLEAREHLEHILGAHPGFLDARAGLGLAHYLAGDPDEASRHWRECLQRAPGDPASLAYLSLVDRDR